MSCLLSTGSVAKFTIFCDLEKIKDSSSNLWTPERIAGSSEVPHLAMTATKLTLEWTKVTFEHDTLLYPVYCLHQFIVFLMTLVCLLVGLVLGVTIQGVSLTPAYVALTLPYYLSLENTELTRRLPSLLAARYSPNKL